MNAKISVFVICVETVIYSNFKLAIVQLIEEVEEIKKNIRTWGWERHI